MAKNAPLAYIIRRENGKMVVKMPPLPPGGKPRNFLLSKEKRPPYIIFWCDFPERGASAFFCPPLAAPMTTSTIPYLKFRHK